jgi:hypothetical protein
MNVGYVSLAQTSVGLGTVGSELCVWMLCEIRFVVFVLNLEAKPRVCVGFAGRFLTLPLCLLRGLFMIYSVHKIGQITGHHGRVVWKIPTTPRIFGSNKHTQNENYSSALRVNKMNLKFG